MAMVEARDIRKAFGRKKVLSGVSFFIEKGQCVGIAGANGCGKSTLLSVMAGAVRPDGGQILYDGKPAGRQPRNETEKAFLCRKRHPPYQYTTEAADITEN